MDDDISYLRDAFSAMGVASGSASNSSTEKGSMLPTSDLGPFLRPSLEVKYTTLSPNTSVADYLSRVNDQVLAEYNAFLSEASYEKVAVVLARTEKGLDIKTAFKAVQLEPRSDYHKRGDRLEDGELHNHLVVYDGTMYVSSFDRKSKSLRLLTGASWTGRSLPYDMSCSDPDTGKPLTIVLDLGYIGDSINEHAAISALRTKAVSKPTLLTSVASPSSRRLATYVPGGPGPDSKVPINDRQREVLDGLRYDVECIQGPPGTGKSTVIYHIVRSYLPSGSVALATCVQNKAVDAIAEKLATSADVPFFVFGNEARLGLLARQWTLPAQVERDPRVVVLSARFSRIRAVSEAVDSRKSRLIAHGPGGAKHTRYRERVADEVFGLVSASTSESTLRERQNWLARDPWALAWRAVIERRHPRLFEASRLLSLRCVELSVQLDKLKQQVKEELVDAARAILCTVATASRSLLTDEGVAPAASRITAAILDEAGTCPETKLPLLMLLPLLDRIIAIGDQKQLEPFTHIQPGGGTPGGGRSSLGGGQECRSFQRTGYCKFCVRCHFSHGARHKRVSLGGGGGGGDIPTGFFQRVESALTATGGHVPALREQYRMHPAICTFVSDTFYAGGLSTPAGRAGERCATAGADALFWVDYAYDFDRSEGVPERSKSKHNLYEVSCALKLASVAHLRAKSVMIITFYKAQEIAIRNAFKAAGVFEDAGPHGLRICTVDQSQGSEADVVIMSCVRANADRQIGFLSKANRMNVAVSRARERLIVVGCGATLATDTKWAALRDASRRVGVADLPAL